MFLDGIPDTLRIMLFLAKSLFGSFLNPTSILHVVSSFPGLSNSPGVFSASDGSCKISLSRGNSCQPLVERDGDNPSLLRGREENLGGDEQS